jgi:hypothetical protein
MALDQPGPIRPGDIYEDCVFHSPPEDRGVSLAGDLADWTDWDVAAFLLGRVLGLFAGQDFSAGAKGVFWTDNPIGNGLHDALLALAGAHVLEHREKPDEQFRWRREGPD